MKAIKSLVFSLYGILLIITVINSLKSPSLPLILQEVTLLEAPFQLSVRENNLHLCSASILNEKQFITAASCVCGKVASNLVAVHSMHYKKEVDKFRVKKISCPVQYFENPSQFDIAVVRIVDRFKFTREKVPDYLAVKLPDFKTRFEDRHNLVYVGWPAAPPHDVLRTIPLAIATANECKTFLGDQYNKNILCGVTELNPKAQTDVGGPVLTSNLVLIGVKIRSEVVGAHRVYYIMNVQTALLDFIKMELQRPTSVANSPLVSASPSKGNLRLARTPV